MARVGGRAEQGGKGKRRGEEKAYNGGQDFPEAGGGDRSGTFPSAAGESRPRAEVSPKTERMLAIDSLEVCP